MDLTNTLMFGGILTTGYVLYKHAPTIVSTGIDMYVDIKYSIGLHNLNTSNNFNGQVSIVIIDEHEFRAAGKFICWNPDIEIDQCWFSEELIGFTLVKSNLELTDEQKRQIPNYLSKLSGPNGNLLPNLEILSVFVKDLPEELELLVENENYEEFKLK